MVFESLLSRIVVNSNVLYSLFDTLPHRHIRTDIRCRRRSIISM